MTLFLSSSTFSSFSSSSSGFTNIKQHTVISTTASINGGAIIDINSRFGILNAEYKYRFCGLPNGVSIPPRFAAMFCIMNVNAIYFVFFVVVRTKYPSGKNVSSAISFAISIDPMNVMYTSARTAIRAFLKSCTTFLARI